MYRLKYLILQDEIFIQLCLLNLFIKIFFYSVKRYIKLIELIE